MATEFELGSRSSRRRLSKRQWLAVILFSIVFITFHIFISSKGLFAESMITFAFMGVWVTISSGLSVLLSLYIDFEDKRLSMFLFNLGICSMAIWFMFVQQLGLLDPAAILILGYEISSLCFWVDIIFAFLLVKLLESMI